MLLLLSLLSFSKQKIRSQYVRFTDAFIRQNFIKILSNLSMFGIGISTAALVIILSVFNGLEDFTKQLYRSFNAEIKISPTFGKSFEVSDSLLSKIKQISHVQEVTEVIEDNVLLRYKDYQMVVTAKGMTQNFNRQYNIEATIVEGKAQTWFQDHEPRAIIGAGVKHQLGILLSDAFTGLQLWYPKHLRNFINMDMTKAFNKFAIRVGGVFAIEQKYDFHHIIVPIEVMQELLEYTNRRTSIEVKTDGKKSIKSVQKDLKKILGNQFIVATAEEQQADVIRAVRIERFFVMVSLIVVMAIASFNIFFSLALLAIEKKRDVVLLKAMGASKQFILQIFLWEGVIIALIGALVGLIGGFLLCLLQDKFGLVGLGVETTIISAYPVKMEWQDFIITACATIFVTIAASIFPAYNASITEFEK
ncbi:MAG: ABC transporter permease [Cytophagales bacterium]|nr:ABC transporter permease [Cytophagales bacterium]MDW8384438.1 FtsX-like permease family protein [Flammeovirgaceae bacterium]